ncbi:MAG: ACT domain-containing protein [Clostridiales Family XIII bacterium]|jgi:hypothetical protein|nr:ACT domain-containing protein [Clostridiales Family XIII bacterium]
MLIDQISIFAENKPGTLAEITAMLAEASIDIEAFTIADTSEFGILRLIVDAPKKALAVLKLGGWVATLTPVIAVKMDDQPGSLSKILKMFAEAGVSIEYLYAFVAREAGYAYVIFRVEDAPKAVAILEASGVVTAASLA